MQSLHTAGIFTHAVVQEVSEWEIPPSRVVKNNMVAYFCHHFQCEDEHDITKVMRDEGSVTLMLKLTKLHCKVYFTLKHLLPQAGYAFHAPCKNLTKW